ncbi:MAG: hypothetical protein RL139_737 [Gemmatimonadota bacterium]|jgi:hypothetical protein
MATENHTLSTWHYVTAVGDTARVELELPPRQGVQIRILSVDGRTAQATRLLANGITAVVISPTESGRQDVEVRVPATTMRVTQAPDSVAAFADVTIVWELQDASGSVRAPIWMDAGVLHCPSPFLGDGLGGGGCETARGGAPVDVGTGRFQFSVPLVGRPSTTRYWQAILVAHPLAVNGGRQVGFFAPVMAGSGSSARLIVGTGGR